MSTIIPCSFTKKRALRALQQQPLSIISLSFYDCHFLAEEQLPFCIFSVSYLHLLVLVSVSKCYIFWFKFLPYSWAQILLSLSGSTVKPKIMFDGPLWFCWQIYHRGLLRLLFAKLFELQNVECAKQSLSLLMLLHLCLCWWPKFGQWKEAQTESSKSNKNV